MSILPQIDVRFGGPFDVAVIGAGVSGTLVAAQFNRLAPPHMRMVGSDPIH